jgi:hypothetical protein
MTGWSAISSITPSIAGWTRTGLWIWSRNDDDERQIDPETRETRAPSLLGAGGLVVSGCLLRCLSAEAKPVTEVYDPVRVAHPPEVRADLDSPLSLMLG